MLALLEYETTRILHFLKISQSRFGISLNDIYFYFGGLPEIMVTEQIQTQANHTDLENFTKSRSSFDLESQNHFHASITVKQIEQSHFVLGISIVLTDVFVALFCIIVCGNTLNFSHLA